MTDTFWDWAVARYQRNGVAAACLALQDDHGQNVPLLLWAAWAAAHGMRIEPRLAEAVRLARAWSDAVIVPLRGVRRRLKTPLSDGDEVARLKLRERVKAVELEAERAL
ncbi:MAG: TIGR02444 family protein, partial [Asticcacaulis sp.]|nr:TIGR02444 family protein [Asticcacaulis sp.]